VTHEPDPVRVETTVTPALQPKCACGSAREHARECAGCREKRLQRSATGAPPPRLPGSVSEVLGSAGMPLAGDARKSMESRFGHDFSHVRIHDDAGAAASAREVGARAYTVGSHIVFGAGEYAPFSPGGRHLLANELTHTLQQRRVPGMQRQAPDGGTADAAEAEADRVADRVAAPAAGSVVVDDDAAQVGPAQMRKSAFVEAARASACAAADEELARAGRSTEGCPYVERALETYRTANADRINRDLARYVGPSESAAAAIGRVTDRVRAGVRRWVETGQVDAAASGAAATEPSAPEPALQRRPEPEPAASPAGAAQFKLRDGAPAPEAPGVHSVQASLGGGAPLDAGARSRMDRAFGFDFGAVRIHDDSRAHAVAARHDALALTVGSDIAFAPGEYRPGDPAGEALLAHELAHVVQQSEATSEASTGSAALEEDADVAAAHAVLGGWGKVSRFVRRAMPKLRGPIRVSRCTRCPKTNIITRTLSVFQLAGASLQPRTDVAAASAIWEAGAGIRLVPTYHPPIDEPTTRQLIGTNEAPATPVTQLSVEVDSSGASTTQECDNLMIHAGRARAAGAASADATAFYVPDVLFGGHTVPLNRQVLIARTCVAGFTLAHELGHLYLGAGHGPWRSALMHPNDCNVDVDDLECRMARRDDEEAWREYGRTRLPRR